MERPGSAFCIVMLWLLIVEQLGDLCVRMVCSVEVGSLFSTRADGGRAGLMPGFKIRAAFGVGPRGSGGCVGERS